MPSPPVPPPPDSLPNLNLRGIGYSHFVAETPPMPEVPGFTDLSFIARGGLGEVWRAERREDGLPVALKIPLSGNPELTERLMLEAEALRLLDHPHIVRLISVVSDGRGLPVLVMELVEGKPLQALLPPEGFSFTEALGFFLPVLEAVEHAHGLGVIHRDLKPSNILVTWDGVPRVSDFGLASSLDSRLVAFSLTRSGGVAGTVEYLAPECYEPGAEPSVAVDIYSLGVLLYELLTGRPPRGAWQRPSQIRRVDVRLDGLIDDAITPDPSGRLASAAAFRRRLLEIRDSPPRYAGTPLVTRPVRVLDALWTAGGLYFLAAGYCSEQAINNTEVPAVFDLSFGHSQYLGGFWAVWIMACGLGLGGLWQVLRLWRFRGVPLREALPSAFGARAVSPRVAAWLAAVSQVLCLWGPLLLLVLIAGQTWHWISPGLSPWQHCLAVTRWDSELPVSPWTWDPEALFKADRYWIREVVPIPGSSAFYLIDRQSFYIFLQPLLMAAGMAGIFLGMGGTLVAAFGSGTGRRIGLLLLLPVAAWFAWWMPAFLTVSEAKTGRYPTHTRAWRESLLNDILHPDSRLPSLRFGEHFTESLTHDTLGLTPRPLFLNWLDDHFSQKPPLLRNAENVRHWGEWRVDGPERFKCSYTFESYAETPGVSADGTYETLTWTCQMLGYGPSCRISSWHAVRQPLYTVVPRTLTPAEAREWLNRWLDCLSSTGCPDAESLVAPVLLLPDPDRASYEIPVAAETFISPLREERARWRELTRRISGTSSASPAPESLPGGRWRILARVESQGIHPDGTAFSLPPAEWSFELIPMENDWRLLRPEW